MSIFLRVIMVGLIVWGLWRVYTALYPPTPRRRPLRPDAQDEWQDVLEAIDELPETTDPHRRAPDHRANDHRANDHEPRLLQESNQPEGSMACEAIEAAILQEAEMALALVREGDEHERLAAYHEIAIYDKLCTLADRHMSSATRQKIDDIHQRALEIICPPDDDY